MGTTFGDVFQKFTYFRKIDLSLIICYNRFGFYMLWYRDDIERMIYMYGLLSVMGFFILLFLVFLCGFIIFYIRNLIKNLTFNDLFPLDTLVPCHVDRERLNENYFILSNSLKTLLNSGHETGYIIRKAGNVLIFYPTPPNEDYGFSTNPSYITLLEKPNSWLWKLYLDFLFSIVD